MKRVTGLGGVFFKCADPQKTKTWYEKHLGIPTDKYGTSFEWKQSEKPAFKGFTAWSPMNETTDYFDPSTSEIMINYRVQNLPKLLDVLKEEGVTVVGEIQDFEYGKFAHIMDVDGRKVELWEPIDDYYDGMIEVRIKS